MIPTTPVNFFMSSSNNIEDENLWPPRNYHRQQPRNYSDNNITHPMYDAPPPSIPHSINCNDVNTHMAMCNFCKKFYSNDKTVYIIIIGILFILCLLFGKKALGL
jgi:nitrate reductase cytochrome c-type subunit